MLNWAFKSSSREVAAGDSVGGVGQPGSRPLPIYTIIGVVLLILLSLISLLRKPATDSAPKRDTAAPVGATVTK